MNRTEEERAPYDDPEVSAQERFDFYIQSNREDMGRMKLLRKQGTSVICDRSTHSTIAHHRTMDPNIDIGDAEALCRIPTISILLIASREAIEARLSRRENRSRFERDIHFMMRVQGQLLKRPFSTVIDTTVQRVEETLDAALSAITPKL